MKDEKVKRAMLLAGVGMVSLGYVKDLNLPTPLNDDSVTYKRLVEQLQAHYGKMSTSLAARNEFAKIQQKDGQSIDEFSAALRFASLLCKFACDLDMRLRNELLICLRDEAIRKRLMEKDDASFADVIKIAGDLERVSRESRQVGSGEASVSKLTRPGPRPATLTNSGAASISSKPRAAGCWPCGSHEHHRAVCVYHMRGLKCRECGVAGHKATVCQKRNIDGRGQGSDALTPENGQRVQAINITPEDVNCSSISLNAIVKIDITLRKSDSTRRIQVVDQFVVTPRVNGVFVEMNLDTCAEASIA